MTSFIVETNKSDWIITVKRKEKNKSKVNLFMNPIEIENDKSISFYTEKIQKIIKCDFDDIYIAIMNNFEKLNIIPIDEIEIKNNIMNILESY